MDKSCHKVRTHKSNNLQLATWNFRSFLQACKCKIAKEVSGWLQPVRNKMELGDSLKQLDFNNYR